MKGVFIMNKNIPVSAILLVILITSFSFAQVFDWEWQNPTPTGADHNDAIVLSPTKFILAGNGGSVLISTDAGINWEQHNIDPLNRDIYSTTFVGENIGYVAGTGGLIFKTTDGGTTWTEQISGVTNTLWDVDFINTDTGFVVGAAGTVLYTTNGGANWSASNYGTTTLYKIHFITNDLGYMGSASTTTGRLIKTTDGGVTWVDITASVPGLAGTVRGIHFNDSNTGWISNSQGRIFKTTDGGITWSQVYDIGSTTTTIYEVKFIDAFNGYAITTAGRVLKTTDGGTNWTLTQTGATKNLYGLALLGVQSTQAEGISTPVLIGGDAGTIVSSLNDGVTWELVHVAASQEILLRSSFPSENVGYVVGGSITTGNQFGDILKTTDGGLSWTKLPIDPGYRTYSVFFLDENTGYVGERGPTGLYKTTDGGQNWTQLNTGTGTATNIIYDIKFFNENLGLAMYSSGQVARTTDGGSTWSAVSAGWGSAAGYDIFFADSLTVYICGGGGRISKSINAGASFSQLPSLGTATLYSMHFFDTNNGYVVASGGRIYQTTDGISFTEILNPLTTTLYKINFVDNNIGWIGASGGDLYYTEDGGVNWTQSNISLGPSQSIRDIQFAGNRMWIVGTDGMIIRGYADPQIPVELTSFTATLNGSNVTLNWMTASEINNMGFDIERGVISNGVRNLIWEKIGFIKGNGTTTGVNTYSFTDKGLTAGVYNYRIKQIDFDGTFKYYNLSESIEIGVPDKFDLAQNYPNPFNPSTVISYQLPVTGIVTLKVYNVIGQEVAEIVNEVKQAGVHTVQFDGSNLASGVYMYKLSVGDGPGNFVSTKKMMLIK
jgi:photosystem II stability/assembly factor-like uncharacterized protein